MHHPFNQQTPLGNTLAATIAERGPITFADYMQIALYDPSAGYYTNPERQRIGWEGDFITSFDLHPLFGAAIGRQIAEIWERLGRPDPFLVQEDGAARGLLARDILAWARATGSDAPAGFAAALRYRMRDVASGVTGEQTWLAEPGMAWPATTSAPQLILSNELIDAFPVHIIARGPAGWLEIYVNATDDPPYLQELVGPLSSDALAAYFDRFAVRWQDFPLGWRGEINLQAETWLAEAAQRLAPTGAIITIDYGDVAASLYTPARHQGTLLCYREHTLSEEPLAFTGRQDITAHVNFSALIAVGTQHGLALAGLTTQRDFLLALGIREDVTALEQLRYPNADAERHTDAGQIDYLRRASLRQRIATLLDPAGLGGFRVLIQQRGLPTGDGPLRGLGNGA